MTNQKDKIWFITGASKGIGLELTKTLLANGNKVVATSRNAKSIEGEIGNSQNLLALSVDLASDTSVKNAIDKAIKTYGKIDVVVNNAGYWTVGSMEEMSDKEFRQSVDINLFGTVNVIRSVMPYLRKLKSGHIINISSVAGYAGFASSASYTAAKFAVIGLSESLAQEVNPFNIKVTVVSPGVFRTNFLNTGSLQTAENLIDEYQTKEKIGTWRQLNGNQSGDPAKLVQILMDITELENPPLHLLLGPDAYQLVSERRKAEEQEFEQWKHLTLSTNFDEK
ncbi:SDR family NAD(P)-dependent oxidoreductase [Fulvivirgaceae bacterium LMO-SS25]